MNPDDMCVDEDARARRIIICNTIVSAAATEQDEDNQIYTNEFECDHGWINVETVFLHTMT